MRAIVISRPGPPDVLILEERPTPRPGTKEVLVRVYAAGVNRADVLQRRGRYPAPPGYPPDIPGLEFAGEVEEVGPEVSEWQPGDRVMGITGGGAYAEALTTSAAELIPIPVGLSLEEAAALPEATLTAWDALFLQADAQALETVLIHAVGSGVGLAALQLARAHGLHTLGSSRTLSKLERARALGLEHALHTPDGHFAEQCLERTGGRGVDVILDFMGADYLEQNLRVLATAGRLIVLGLLRGATASLSLGPLLTRRLSLRGTTLRSRSSEEKQALCLRFREEVLPLIESGLLLPNLDRVMPMEQAGEAHALMESDRNFGKLVLRW